MAYTALHCTILCRYTAITFTLEEASKGNITHAELFRLHLHFHLHEQAFKNSWLQHAELYAM